MDPYADWPAAVPPTGAATRLIGTWLLDDAILPPEARALRGARPTGVLFYDPLGFMSAQIVPDRSRPAYRATTPTEQEALAAIIGFASYFGPYTVEPDPDDPNKGLVTHRRVANLRPGAIGDAGRRYTLLADGRLQLRPVENENALIWRRLG